MKLLVPLLISLMLSTMLLSLQGCGASLQDNARTVVDISTEAVIAADTVVGAAYLREARQHIDLPDGEFAHEMELFDALVDAVKISMASMLTVRAALIAWEESEDAQSVFFTQLACWVRTAVQLREVAELVGLRIPIPSDAQLLVDAANFGCPDRPLVPPEPS